MVPLKSQTIHTKYLQNLNTSLQTNLSNKIHMHWENTRRICHALIWLWTHLAVTTLYIELENLKRLFVLSKDIHNSLKTIFLCCESINYESENHFDSLVYNDISWIIILLSKNIFTIWSRLLLKQYFIQGFTFSTRLILIKI